MRILIISKEAWRDEQNGGNVLTNLFTNFPHAEFAQIYCNEQEPNNPICKLYYQMTDKMMVNNILHKTKVGRILKYDLPPTTTGSVIESYKGAFASFAGLKRIAREVVWSWGKWDSNEIISYTRDFGPDLIFAPCYGNHYMQKLMVLIHNAINVPVISYISDDFYTNKQFKLSPLYWMNHYLLRRRTRQTFKHYSLCYTMTDEQKKQCESDFCANMKILRKNGRFEDRYLKRSINNPIRFVYAGGIYLNRWKTLSALARAMRSINKDGVKMVLDIYTNTPLDKKMTVAINDGITSRVHQSICMKELMSVYHQSDVALHVEAFDIANRFAVRMSFSTKIIDCLDSGCAVMAICDKEQAGGAYLRKQNCAICVNDISLLEQTLQEVIDNPNLLIDLQHKAFQVGRTNHLQENITKELLIDFKDVMLK